MDVTADVYKKFFELLCEAISRRAFPDTTASLKEIANASMVIGGKNENISEKIFKSPFKYFIDRRTEANKGNIVSIKDFRLVRALEFIAEVPEKSLYIGDDWGVAAELLLNKFEKLHVPNKSNDSAIGSDRDVESVFIEVITGNENVFKSKKMIELSSFFFDALNDDKWLDAWNMLSPGLQKKSIWNGDIELFVLTWIFFEKIESTPYHSGDFKYEYQTVKYAAEFTTTFSAFTADSIRYYLLYSEDLDLEFIEKVEANQFQKLNIKWYAHEKLSEMSTRQLENPLFQVFFYNFWISEKSDPTSFKREHPTFDLEKKGRFRVYFVLKWFSNKWLIDEMSITEQLFAIP